MAVGTSRAVASVDADALPAPEPYRLSVDQFHRMLALGILMDDEPVELLEGCLVKQMTKKPAHVVATGLVQDVLTPLLPHGWHLSVQDPVTTEESEPEPDIKVVRGERRDYVARHPGPDEVALVVEVADTSLAVDRGIKKRIYARAGMPYYWLVNLADRRLEVYSDPTGPDPAPDYRRRQDFEPDEVVVLIVDGQAAGRVRVSDLLP
jgi:Uma2 family endonuclease